MFGLFHPHQNFHYVVNSLRKENATVLVFQLKKIYFAGNWLCLYIELEDSNMGTFRQCQGFIEWSDFASTTSWYFILFNSNIMPWQGYN